MEVIERRQKDDNAERQWYGTIKRWRGWLDESARADQAQESLLGYSRSARRAGVAADA